VQPRDDQNSTINKSQAILLVSIHIWQASIFQYDGIPLKDESELQKKNPSTCLILQFSLFFSPIVFRKEHRLKKKAAIPMGKYMSPYLCRMEDDWEIVEVRCVRYC